MSTLDRAFIKAFNETESPLGIVVGTAPVVESSVAVSTVTEESPPAPTVASIPTEQRTEQRSEQRTVAPLSSFVTAPQVHLSTRPMLEVDRLRFPETTDKLLSVVGPAWQTFADLLAAQAAAGHKLIALTSCRRGEGRTTIALATAKILAARGLNVVVVDADFEHPDLCRTCGISADNGWREVLTNELPLGEALISAVEDRLTLMPWSNGPTGTTKLVGSLRSATSFTSLAEQYDVVLIDCMPLEADSALGDFAGFAQAIKLDALYMVRDVRATRVEDLEAICARLRRAGQEVSGLVDNFVLPSTLAPPSEEPPPSFATRFFTAIGRR